MLNIVRAWVLLSAWLVCTGWLLSALHQLNRLGYGAVLGVTLVGLLARQKGNFAGWQGLVRGARQCAHRWRRPLPLLFLALVACALVAGALYPSSNNDSNEYRIPRVWHWLAQGQWHWIHTLDDRMNIAGNGFEWLAAPLMLFTGTDRLIFLVNWFSLLLLPGLIFSVFTRLGVRPRVAWWWMWPLASGWCYVMQASSTANDSFAVIYALAAVDLALRAREKQSAGDLLLSLLAAALLTGAKQTCLPLAALWAVAAWPAAKLFLARPALTLLAAAAGVVVSAAPMIYFNLAHTGSWIGMSADSYWARCALKSPFWGVVGNGFCIPEENLQPPYLPGVKHWNEAMRHFVSTPFGSHFSSFENFGRMAQGASEGDAGIGLWIVLLAVVSLGAARYYRGRQTWTGAVPGGGQAWVLRWLPWGVLLAFMAKVGTYPIARQLAAYYVFLFACFLVGRGQGVLVRRGWWQKLVMLTMVLTAGILVVARDRPLFPAMTVLGPLKEKHPGWKFLATAWDSYACRVSVQTQRDVFRNRLPPEEAVIGYGTLRGSQEAGLWLPFGRRRVERVLPADTAPAVWSKDVHYVVLDSEGLTALNLTLGGWTNRFDAVLVDAVEFETRPGETARDYLVRLNPPGPKPAL